MRTVPRGGKSCHRRMRLSLSHTKHSPNRVPILHGDQPAGMMRETQQVPALHSSAAEAQDSPKPFKTAHSLCLESGLEITA
ncbi:hypothetical protein DV515_00009644, partial [Chloebia gouldiae]